MSEYIIDSHAHLCDSRFDEDRQEIIDNLEKDKVKLVIIPGTDLESSLAAVDLANKNERIYALVGTHPHDAKDYTNETRESYKKLALENKKVLAIGEIGLDYHYEYSPVEKQKEVFIDQIELAKELDLPIVIHSREAFEDTYQILKDYAKGMKVLLHSFNETWEDLTKYLDLDFYISLGGMSTFKNADNLVRVAERVPIDRVFLETDAPYLTPVPHRGKRNEPKYTHFVAERLAKMRVEDLSYIKEETNKNTMKFFGIEDGR
ncbi:TatD family hydrolase [uncultured Helcococcus sp.]|uniref:TatD family hydrolase n=1 Tax=uncultured Helcococcus sp. TaxID=1072508 RepID=UPI0026045571|nr:TatD family hydrolase [uncultured Helcococcus sp.]